MASDIFSLIGGFLVGVGLLFISAGIHQSVLIAKTFAAIGCLILFFVILGVLARLHG